MKAILGIKKGMARIFVDDRVVPVTLVDVTGCKVANIRKDGKVELGLGNKKKGTKAQLGQYKELGYVPMYKWVVESELPEGFKAGSELVAETFNEGDTVTVTGISKGKGFQGVVKRHGFKGGPRTHGQSDRLRAPGAIGARTTPGRVYKGKRMAGRMGHDTVTIKNKRIVGIKENILLISGPLPGSNGDLVKIYTE